MTTLRLFFAGQIKKAETRMAGDTPILELSVCKKNYAKPGVEPTFTWINCTIFKPADFQVQKCIKGAFVAGCGEFTLRSYEGKDGKAVSADVRCGSFDVECGSEADAAPAPAATPRRAPPVHRTAPAPSGGSVPDDVPFAPDRISH